MKPFSRFKDDAQEAYVLTDIDVQAINKLLVGYGRRLLKGKACTKTILDDGTVKYTSLTNQQVWEYIGCVPIQYELRIRRLKWLQDLVKNLANNKLVIASLLGEFAFENEQGLPNPWTEQLLQDISELSMHEKGEELIIHSDG